MNLIEMKDIEVYHGSNHVLKGISLEINKGEKVALVGSNGSGKTTIFNVLAGNVVQDKGDLFIEKNTRFGFVEQIPDVSIDMTAIDVVNLAFDKVLEIKEKMSKIEELMVSGTVEPNLLAKYGEYQERFEHSGGYEIESKIFRVCTGLKINEENLKKNFNNLSGGEKTRVLLAKAILREPEVLLLDEPTNHLDLTSIEWLEGYIKEYKGTILIVSHDRYFLDNVVSKIIEIEDGKARMFKGNYTYYQREKAEILRIKEHETALQKQKIRKIEATVKMLHDWGEKASGKKGSRESAGVLHAAALKLKEEANEQKRVLKREEEQKLEGSFSASKFSSQDVAVLRNVSKIYGSKCILNNESLVIKKGEAVGIIGDNGTGKSTILKILINEINPDEGTAKLGDSVTAAYLPQHIKFEKEELSIIDTVKRELKIAEDMAIPLLIKFKFCKAEFYKAVCNISGGEKIRLKICILMQKNVNLLLLDEPTNHLDFKAREWLENAIEEFDGTLIFVSHDRYFINKFAERILEFKNGRIYDYKGGYAYYNELKRKEQSFSKEKTADNEKVSKQRKNFIGKNEYRADKTNIKDKKTKNDNFNAMRIEAEIEELEKMKKECKEKLDSETDYNKLNDILVELNDIDNRIYILMEEWEKYCY